MGMINDFIQKEEQIKGELFTPKGSKHYCIFEISHPNNHSEITEAKFVQDFDSYDAADEFCQSMNNFRKPEWPVYYCVRCLEQEEYDNIENYSPFTPAVVITKAMVD